MARQIPGIPKGTMLYRVECLFYGKSDPRNVAARPILVETFSAWGQDTAEADEAVRSFLKAQHVELIKIISMDVAQGVIRERIVNDDAFDAGTPVMQIVN